VDIRIPDELRIQIPQLGEAEQPDPMVWLKLTCEQAGWTWYILLKGSSSRRPGNAERIDPDNTPEFQFSIGPIPPHRAVL